VAELLSARRRYARLFLFLAWFARLRRRLGDGSNNVRGRRGRRRRGCGRRGWVRLGLGVPFFLTFALGWLRRAFSRGRRGPFRRGSRRFLGSLLLGYGGLLKKPAANRHPFPPGPFFPRG